MKNMGFGIKLKVWGAYACFTRPELRVERVSYDVMTPSAARGIIEAIYYKPAIRWVIDKIHVMNAPIFENIKRNEITHPLSVSALKKAYGCDNTDYMHIDPTTNRSQRNTLLLRDVSYVIEAHFELTELAGVDDTKEKHYNVAIRRMKKGQCYNQPYFGCREFPAHFEFVDGEIDRSQLTGTTDLGYMIWDQDYQNKNKKSGEIPCIHYRAIMSDGVIDVKKCVSKGAVA
jgi:CRISPR-associated protein Cas5d